MSEDVTVQPPPPARGATASLVLGVFSLIPFVGIVPGIIAIVLGNMARIESNGELGTAGFVLGIVGILVSLLFIVMMFVGAITMSGLLN